MVNSIVDSCEHQLRLLRRVIKTLFAIAGCMWILKYVVHFPDEISIQMFALGQYQLYLILLTLWGYDYKRESGRLKILNKISNESNCKTNEITVHQIQEYSAGKLFTVLTKQEGAGGWFTLVLIWGLLIISVFLVVKQIIFLINLNA